MVILSPNKLQVIRQKIQKPIRPAISTDSLNSVALSRLLIRHDYRASVADLWRTKSWLDGTTSDSR